MAKVVLNTLGSWGDLFPLLPIATEMRRRGHDVAFAVPSGFVEVVEGEGFHAVAIAARATIRDRIDQAASYDVRPRSPMAVADEETLARVTQAFLSMKKFDIAKLEEAYAGR